MEGGRESQRAMARGSAEDAEARAGPLGRRTGLAPQFAREGEQVCVCERERECVCVKERGCVCVCVCVGERERERAGGRDREREPSIAESLSPYACGTAGPPHRF